MHGSPGCLLREKGSITLQLSDLTMQFWVELIHGGAGNFWHLYQLGIVLRTSESHRKNTLQPH